MSRVLVVGEQQGGVLQRMTLEALAAGQRDDKSAPGTATVKVKSSA